MKAPHPGAQGLGHAELLSDRLGRRPLPRKINTVTHEIKLICAPTLHLLPTLRILYPAIVMTVTDNYQSIAGKISPDKKRDSALLESLAIVYEQFSTWTKFWLGILFDWLLTQMRLILRRVAMMMAMVV